ncbi:hypothetical protein F5Y05DRAFT_415636 [Hypoxylon sp. FL0543]|nr:hypothetical protein F5Y05DRAFT_415636 [Hypoxylon sp. FL0543]
MFPIKAAFAIVMAFTAVSAHPASLENSLENSLVRRVQCGSDPGDCYSNGCEGHFSPSSNTTGICTAGNWNGCSCRKCGGKKGGYIGSCDDNGCEGIAGTCTAGNYEGCPCAYF